MVVFGASGDLALPKLFPSLFHRFKDGQIPSDSRIVGVATGIQDKFSWKGVAMAFISGGVSGGLSGVAALNSGTTTLSRVFQAGVRGAATSAISQGIGVTLGLQDKFSWAGVAAAGVGAGIGHAVGGTQFAKSLTAKSEIAGDLYVGMADAMGQAATLSLIQGTDFGDNLIASLPSVLGGAIGRRIGGAIQEALETKNAQVEPLVIKPINDKIEVDLSRAALDPVTAKLPPEGQQNVQNGPSNLNAAMQLLALTSEGEDFQFRMQAVGVEAAQRRRDLATIAAAPSNGESPNTGPTWPFGEFENTGKLSDIAKRPFGFAYAAAEEVWRGMEGGFGGGAVPAVRGIAQGAQNLRALEKIRELASLGPGKIKAPVSSAFQASRLKEHLRQLAEYGKGGFRELENRRIRYFGRFVTASKLGEMAGARLVREWNPATGKVRTWYETLDHSGNIRSVAPKPPTGPKNHHIFDSNGNYRGRR